MFGLPALRHTPTLPPLAVVADRSERPFRSTAVHPVSSGNRPLWVVSGPSPIPWPNARSRRFQIFTGRQRQPDSRVAHILIVERMPSRDSVLAHPPL